MANSVVYRLHQQYSTAAPLPLSARRSTDDHYANLLSSMMPIRRVWRLQLASWQTMSQMSTYIGTCVGNIDRLDERRCSDSKRNINFPLCVTPMSC